MKKIITIAVATIMAIGVTAAPATAETLYRNGANKVTIKPWFPGTDSIQPIKERITVKKGKKTVAKNKAFYKAKKGKYKVTSTRWYVTSVDRWVEGATTTVPGTIKSLDRNTLWLDTCVVRDRIITQDNSFYRYWDGQPDYLTGEVWVDYYGSCDAGYYDETFTWRTKQNVQVKWTESPYLFNINVTGNKDIDLYSDNDFLYIGQFADGVDYKDWTLISPETYTTASTTTTAPGYWVTDVGTTVYTMKDTRTVVVR